MAEAKARRRDVHLKPDDILNIHGNEYKHGFPVDEETRDKMKLINSGTQWPETQRYSWPTFDIFSMNMNQNGAESVVSRRRICLSFCLNHRSLDSEEPYDIVFAQEVFSPTKPNFSLDMSKAEFDSRGTPESGLMSRGSRFAQVFHLDAAYKQKVQDHAQKLLNSKGITGDCSYFSGRTTAAVLKCTDSPSHGCLYILVISWHGKNYRISAQRKREDFIAFQYFAVELRKSLPAKWKEMTDKSIGIVIGGDFNLDLLKEESRMHPDFAMQRYQMTKRRRISKKSLIDAFLFTHAQLTILSTRPLELDMTSKDFPFDIDHLGDLSQEVLHSVDHDPIRATLMVRPLLWTPTTPEE